MTENKRFYTDTELEEFSKQNMELALESIERGDIERARYWCERTKVTAGYLHEPILFGIAGMATYIHERWGEESFVALTKEVVRQSAAELYEKKQELVKEKGIRGHVEFVVDYMWRHHLGVYTVDEDDEKIIFTHKPCGDGGKIIDGKGYEGPEGFARLKNAGPHTWGKENVPIHCARCTWFHEIWPVHLFGDGAQLWVHASPFPENPGDPCVHHIYKNPKDIPEEYYRKIGMEKSKKDFPPIKKERILTDEEAEELSKDFMELALAALEKGDLEKAKHWCQKHQATEPYIHDSYVVWMSAALTYVYEHWGEEEAKSMLKDQFGGTLGDEPFFKRKKKYLEDEGVTAWVEFLVDFLRQHCGSYTLEEDDEKFIFTNTPCGSGGKLIDQGYYSSPAGHARIKSAGPDTWGKSDVPIYCGHCPWFHEISAVELHGAGAQLWVHADRPDKPGESCIYHIYKDPNKIPQHYYDRIGKGDQAPRIEIVEVK